MQKKLIFILIAFSLLFPLVSAYGFNLGYYNTPLDYLENEWVMFAILITVFFATIFYTLYKVFKNKGIAAVVSIGLSLLITMAIMQKGLIESYGGGEISSWALFLAAVVGIGFLIRFSSESFGKIGCVAMVVAIWAVLHNFYADDLLPETLSNIPAFLGFFEWFITGWPGLIIGVGLAFAFAGNKGPRETYDGFVRTFRR